MRPMMTGMMGDYGRCSPTTSKGLPSAHLNPILMKGRKFGVSKGSSLLVEGL